MFQALVNQVTARVDLDEVRQRFAEATCRTLADLEYGRITSNGRCRMLLGQRGAGKTHLLKALEEAARDHSANIMVVHIDCEVGPTLTPVEHIAQSLHMEKEWEACQDEDHAHTQRDALKRFEKLLSARRSRVFLVCDEVQNYYKAACANGKYAVRQLAYIGDSWQGNIFCVLCGSVPHLRELLCGKLPAHLKDTYTHYQGVDLNDTKFCPRLLPPLVKKDTGETADDKETTMDNAETTCDVKV